MKPHEQLLLCVFSLLQLELRWASSSMPNTFLSLFFRKFNKKAGRSSKFILRVRSTASEMSLAASSGTKLHFHDSVPGFKCSPVGIRAQPKGSHAARRLMCSDSFFGTLITTVAPCRMRDGAYIVSLCRIS